MSKDELLEALQTALVTESASAIAIHNMIGTFTWSGLPDSLQRKVVEDLAHLSTSSQRRAKRLKDLIARI